MKGITITAAVMAIASVASGITVGSPEIASMDPFCAS